MGRKCGKEFLINDQAAMIEKSVPRSGDETLCIPFLGAECAVDRHTGDARSGQSEAGYSAVMTIHDAPGSSIPTMSSRRPSCCSWMIQ